MGSSFSAVHNHVLQPQITISDVTRLKKPNGVKRSRETEPEPATSPKRLRIQSSDKRRPSHLDETEGLAGSETLATPTISKFSSSGEADPEQKASTDSSDTEPENDQSRDTETSDSEGNQLDRTVSDNNHVKALVEESTSNEIAPDEPRVDEEVANRPVARPEHFSRLFDIFNRWERAKFTCRMANIQDSNRELTQDALQEEREIRRWMTMSRAPYPTRWEKQTQSQSLEDYEEMQANGFSETAVNDSRKLTTFGISIGDDENEASDEEGGDTETVGSFQCKVSHVEGKKALHWRYINRYSLYHTYHPLGFDPENALNHPAMAHVSPHLRAAASEYLAEMLRLHASRFVSEDEELSPEGVIARLFAEVQTAEAGSAYALDINASRETRHAHAKLATRLVCERANERLKKPEEPEPEWLKRNGSDKEEGKKKKKVSFGEIPPGHDDGQHTRFPRGGDKKRHRVEAHNILGGFRKHMERENALLIEFLRADKEDKLRRQQEVTGSQEKRTARVSAAGPSRVLRVPTPPLQGSANETGGASSGIEQPQRSGLYRMNSMYSIHDFIHADERQMRCPSAPAVIPTRSILSPQSIISPSALTHRHQRDRLSRPVQLEADDTAAIRSPSGDDSHLCQLLEDEAEDIYVNAEQPGLVPRLNGEHQYTGPAGELQEKPKCSDEKGKWKESATSEIREDMIPHSHTRSITPPLQSSENLDQLDSNDRTLQSMATTIECDVESAHIENEGDIQDEDDSLGKITGEKKHDSEEVKRDLSDNDSESENVASVTDIVHVDSSISGSDNKENTGDDDDSDKAAEKEKKEGAPLTDSFDLQDSVTTRTSGCGDVTYLANSHNGLRLWVQADNESRGSGFDFNTPPRPSRINDDRLCGCLKPLRVPRSTRRHRYRPY